MNEKINLKAQIDDCLDRIDELRSPQGRRLENWQRESLINAEYAAIKVAQQSIRNLSKNLQKPE